MDKRVTVISLESKVENVEVKTNDAKYCLTGQRTTDKHGVRAFDGGGVIRLEDGVEIARIESWSRHGGLSMRTNPGQDIMVAVTVVKELVDAFTGADVQPAEKEGGAA